MHKNYKRNYFEKFLHKKDGFTFVDQFISMRQNYILFFGLPGELGYNHEQLVMRHLRKDKMSARVVISI